MEILNVFDTLNLKQILWQTKTLFRKLENRFLVGSTKIENATCPYKAALSEAHVKTNQMGSTKGACHKEWSFARNYFMFLKILFKFKNLL